MTSHSPDPASSTNGGRTCLFQVALFAGAGGLFGYGILAAGFVGIAGAGLISVLICLGKQYRLRLSSFYAGLGWTIAGITASVVARMPTCGSAASGNCYAPVTVPVLAGAAATGLLGTFAVIRWLAHLR